MLVPSPTQATAVRDWLLDALNTGDFGAAIVPAPFSTETVVWGYRDHPRPAGRHAILTPISLVSRGLTHWYNATNVDDPGTRALTEVRHDWKEWAVSVTVVSRLDPLDPQLSDTASIHLQRARGAFWGETVYPLDNVGVAPLRAAEIIDVSRLQGGTEWETRASVVLTWLVGWYATRDVDFVGRVTGQGEVSPLAPLPLDSDLGDL